MVLDNEEVAPVIRRLSNGASQMKHGSIVWAGMEPFKLVVHQNDRYAYVLTDPKTDNTREAAGEDDDGGLPRGMASGDAYACTRELELHLCR